MNLAAELMAADVHHEDVKNRIEALLTGLFASWQSWLHVKPDGIEVWQAIDSKRAADVLHRHGFRWVMLHRHRAERFLPCECQPRELE
jgi:hypothetical protein